MLSSLEFIVKLTRLVEVRCYICIIKMEQNKVDNKIIDDTVSVRYCPTCKVYFFYRFNNSNYLNNTVCKFIGKCLLCFSKLNKLKHIFPGGRVYESDNFVDKNRVSQILPYKDYDIFYYQRNMKTNK